MPEPFLSSTFVQRLRGWARDTNLANAMLWRLHRAQEWLTRHGARGLRRTMTPYGFPFTTERTRTGRQMQRGAFEPDEVAFVRDALANADFFVDVGANIGLFSCLAAQAGVRVVAVEPQPSNVELLCRNLHDSGWDDAEVYPVVLAERPGIVGFFGDSGTSASLLGQWAGQRQRRRDLPASTLDRVLGGVPRGARLLIKVDVEGGEHAVLLGATQTLHREPAPVWLVEIFLEHHHPGAPNPQYLATFEQFWQAGYEAFVVGEVTSPVTPAMIESWVARGYADPWTYNFAFRRSA